MFRLTYTWTTLLTALLLSNYAQAISTEIYQPSYKPAQELIDTLAPLYPTSKLTTDQQQIIIRGELSDTREIQELLLQLDHPSRRFQVEISNQVDRDNLKTYSTSSHHLHQEKFILEENKTLILSKGIKTQQINNAGPLWLQVESKPVQQEFIKMKIQAANERVYLVLELQTLNNGNYEMFSNTISGPTGQWLAINNNKLPSQQRQWSTNRQSIQHLYVKISVIE